MGVIGPVEGHWKPQKWLCSLRRSVPLLLSRPSQRPGVQASDKEMLKIKNVLKSIKRGVVSCTTIFPFSLTGETVLLVSEYPIQLKISFIKLKQKFRALTQHFRALTQHFRALTQHFRALNQHFRALTQHFRTLTQHFRALKQHFRALNQHFRALTQHFRALTQH